MTNKELVNEARRQGYTLTRRYGDYVERLHYVGNFPLDGHVFAYSIHECVTYPGYRAKLEEKHQALAQAW